jgi:hypothetical protein
MRKRIAFVFMAVVLVLAVPAQAAVTQSKFPFQPYGTLSCAQGQRIRVWHQVQNGPVHSSSGSYWVSNIGPNGPWVKSSWSQPSGQVWGAGFVKEHLTAARWGKDDNAGQFSKSTFHSQTLPPGTNLFNVIAYCTAG